MRFIRASTFALVLVPSLSHADPYDPRDGRLQLMVANAIGSCKRHDLYTGTTGFCAELFTGGIRVHSGRFDFVFEGGLGASPFVERHDPGVRARGGGLYWMVRSLGGIYFGPSAFFRIGPEVRFNAPLGSLEARPQAASELGIHTPLKVALGIRFILGVESTRTAFADNFESGSALAYETMFFLRWGAR